MDPIHHHMTSEYTRGHEYQTYHYEDKDHKPLQFTVTRPAETDIVAKGGYYHAHPRDVPMSYYHETAPAHAYTVEHVPIHHGPGHAYATDYPHEEYLPHYDADWSGSLHYYGNDEYGDD